MSTTGGKKGAGKGPPKKPPKDDEEKSAPKAGEPEKDETASNTSDKKEGKDANGDTVPTKPPSAGVNMREAAAKILILSQKGEWSAVEQTLKVLEKIVAVGGEDTNQTPMAGVLDPGTGMTPLMYAVKDNRTSFVERLIELGSDVGARNNDNYNVLHISAMYSREDVVKLLLSKRGVDPFATGGSRQQTAVHLVASRQTGTATSILRALLTAAGKDIRLKPDGDAHRLSMEIACLVAHRDAVPRGWRMALARARAWHRYQRAPPQPEPALPLNGVDVSFTY